MKKNLLKLLTASALVVTGLAADGKYAGENGLYVGGTLGGGAGSLSYETDYGSYTYAEDGISTTDMKIYAGKRSLYIFMQMGTISTDTSALSDMDYTAYGLGYLWRSPRFAMDLDAVTIMPQFDAEIAYDTTTLNSVDMSGFLVSADIGVAIATPSLPALEFTVDLGYDLHALTDDSAYSGTWNFGALTFNVGAKYNF